MKSRILKGFSPCVSSALVLSLSLVLSPAVVQAQELVKSGIAPEIRAELGYAQQLKSWGFPDYAMIVLDRLRGQDPRVKFYIDIIEMESLIAIGKFDEAKKIIAGKSDQNSAQVWGMKLALADGYFAWGRYPEAQGIYEGLFKQFPNGPSEDLNDFYMNSAYKYAQMLILMGEQAKAVEAYRNVTKAKLLKHVRRQVLCEMAELMVKLAETADTKKGQIVEVQEKDSRGRMRTVKRPADSMQDKYFAEVKALTTEILWEQDVWFGKAIVLLAHMRLIQGDIAGAESLVDEYKKQLQQVDEVLRKEEADTGEPLSKLSPMAECRYLLGVIRQEEAQKIIAAKGDMEKVKDLLAGTRKADGTRESNGALHHFLNVFIGYPETSWAPDAGVRAKQVEGILVDKFGATIKTNVDKDKMARVEKAQFQNALSLYNQKQFQNAADALIKVLNLFPESEPAVYALGALSTCYVELEEEQNVDVTTRYLAERFSGKRDASNMAGDQILRVAEMYGERNIINRKDLLYNLFFEYFKEHPLAPALMFRFGEVLFGQQEYAGALPYYERVAVDYTNAPVFKDALNKITYCHNQLENTVEEIKTLEVYIQVLERDLAHAGSALISAKFRCAAAYKKLGSKYTGSAYKRFDEIVTLLSAPNHPYDVAPEDTEKNRDLLEGAILYKAVCLAQLTTPEDKLKAYKALAIKSLESLLEKFPKSRYAPSALLQIGTLYTILEDAAAAGQALSRLKKDYPESIEAKNADFMLGKSLLEQGRRQQAVRLFKQMFAGQGSYSDTDILTASRELSKAGENEIAIEGFDRLLAKAESRAILEPALLGKGAALVGVNRFLEAGQVLDELLKKYPNSGFTIEASFLLSRAYSEAGAKEPDAKKQFDLFNKAVVAMQDARKFEKTPGGLARLDIEIGRILVRKGNAEEQFGDKGKAEQYYNDALATFQTLVLLGDPNNVDVRPFIGDGINESLPLLLKIERWADVVENAEEYIQAYPSGPHLAAVRSAYSRAKVKLATRGEPKTETPATTLPEGGTPGAAQPSAEAGAETAAEE